MVGVPPGGPGAKAGVWPVGLMGLVRHGWGLGGVAAIWPGGHA